MSHDALRIDLLKMNQLDKPVAYMFGLPLNASEALAYMAFSAGTHSEADLKILHAWVVAMTLVHGSWVADEVPFALPI